MDGEGEVDRHRSGAASFASLLLSEEKRRTSLMQSVFEAPAVASALPSKMGVGECRSCSVTDVFDRPLSYCCDVSPSCAPPSVTGDAGNDGGKKKEEERREDRTEEEEEREKLLSISSNVDDDNEEEEGGGGEEKEEQEEEEEEKEEVVEQEEAIHGSHIRRYQRRLSIREVRHFPPPIPLLAQTGNLQCHMPWILKRSYKKDGRLVLREVKVKHHEFFRAHRSNGRLTLQVVHFEDSSRAHLDQHRHEEEEEEEEEEKEKEEEGEEGEEGTEADPPPSPASPRSSSSTISPPPPASSTSTSDQDEKGLHEINPQAPASVSPSTPSSSSPFFSSDSQSTLSSSSSCNDENDNEGNDVESSIKPDRTATLCIEENMNASMGIVGGCFANSLVQMPIPTIRPVIS
ncbi:uncharacterized protein [Aristolochia californica]|uniref:uncharacterized protein n=1 Tax=Aristolochia californica TaxID=171875 RepID=UPI0035DF4DE8